MSPHNGCIFILLKKDTQKSGSRDVSNALNEWGALQRDKYLTKVSINKRAKEDTTEPQSNLVYKITKKTINPLEKKDI